MKVICPRFIECGTDRKDINDEHCYIHNYGGVYDITEECDNGCSAGNDDNLDPIEDTKCIPVNESIKIARKYTDLSMKEIKAKLVLSELKKKWMI